MSNESKLLVIRFDLETGDARYLYHDALAGVVAGKMRMTRASNIVFNEATQRWEVVLPSGEVVFTSTNNQECYRWERRYFNRMSVISESQTRGTKIKQ